MFRREYKTVYGLLAVQIGSCDEAMVDLCSLCIQQMTIEDNRHASAIIAKSYSNRLPKISQ